MIIITVGAVVRRAGARTTRARACRTRQRPKAKRTRRRTNHGRKLALVSLRLRLPMNAASCGGTPLGGAEIEFAHTRSCQDAGAR